jgi:hypothetical protein
VVHCQVKQPNQSLINLYAKYFLPKTTSTIKFFITNFNSLKSLSLSFPEFLSHLSLSHEGRGIAHLDEKVIFVSGALPGETVIAERCFSRAKFEEAQVSEVLLASPKRMTPKCAVFGFSFLLLPISHTL